MPRSCGACSEEMDGIGNGYESLDPGAHYHGDCRAGDLDCAGVTVTVTGDTIVVGVAPNDIPLALFEQVQRDANSPAADAARDAYATLSSIQVSIAFCLAVFHHESQYGKLGICHDFDTKSPGNTRSTRTGIGTVITIPNRGPFVRYPRWQDGWQDLAFRLVDPNYAYAKEGRRTIRQIIERFAPVSDNNRPDAYINAVVNDMNRWIDEAAPVPPLPSRPLHVALSAGHHNTSGGNATEITQTGPLTAAIAAACRSAGFDVRVVQPHDGMGSYPGSLSDVAQVVVDWDRAGWTVDLFLEAHTEGAGGTRGAFSIFPDWPPDVDVDVRDTIGPDIVTRLNASTGMPVRNLRPPGRPGAMSERQTGVGAEGHRLGIFRITEPLRDHTTRLIVEFGAHDNTQDMAIFNAPGFLNHAGAAVAESIAAFYGVTPTPQPPPADPNARQFSTGHWIINIPEAPMLMFFDGNGGIDRLGLPLAGMRQDADGVYRQLLENCEIESWPNGFGVHQGVHVRLGGLGQRYLALVEAA